MRKSAEFTKELANVICLSGPVVDDGAEITNFEAIEAITDFTVQNGDCDVRAFHFGLNTLKTMIDKAEDYNESDPEIPIVGFRFYQAITSRILRGGGEIDKKEDLVIFPALENNNNHTGPIISHSRPCPKLCDPLGPLRLTPIQ